MMDQSGNPQPVELTILMPCLNEAETVGICVKKAIRFLRDSKIKGEVLVADNGSSDGSPDIAAKQGARIVHVAQKGYGSALSGGIEAARGNFIIMGDADDSLDFSAIMPFLEKLHEGYDFVIGNRFQGGIESGGYATIESVYWKSDPYRDWKIIL